MTLHEIIEEIKEMDRGIRFPESLYEAGQKDAYQKVLDLLTKAESEQPVMDYHELEKEIFEVEKYGDINEVDGNQILLFDDEFRNILRHFAEWGAENLKK